VSIFKIKKEVKNKNRNRKDQKISQLEFCYVWIFSHPKGKTRTVMIAK
jgi:hypothetical protein